MSSMTVVLMLMVGAVLVYCAIKGIDPRELAKKALTRGKSAVKPAGKAGSAVT